ncbi:histidine phosphatase family protein [Bacillaceae bacterium Marseille-Q3522]|nr:histidine phosphatase family protein [Bacillaceae bacterium Marseille-Q3522]
MTTAKKITFYFIRHGETQYNVEKRMQGFSDSPLTEKGILQAKSVGRGLSDIEFEAAYASDSQRVIDTAKYAIGERNIPLITDKRLREMNFGIWETLKESDVYAQYKDLLETLFSLTDLNVSPPDGESFNQVFARSYGMVKEIINNHEKDGGNILIFSHGVTIGNFFMQLTKSKDYPIHDNCSVSVVRYENEAFHVERLADNSYRDKGAHYFSETME